MTDLRVPDLGDGIDEGIVVAVLVKPGETLVAGQSVLEIETDKVTLEVPAPRAGVITEICIAADATVRPGDVVLRLAEAAPAMPLAAAPATPARAASGEGERASARMPHRVSSTPAASHSNVLPAGPAARREARQLGVAIDEVAGSGPRGRISRDDVRQHVRTRIHAVPAPDNAPGEPALPDLGVFGPLRREAMTRIERATALNLARSAHLVPHAWVSRRVDITALEAARRALRREQTSAEAPLTLTAILCKVLASVLGTLPRFNAAFDGAAQEIVYREYVNIGVAVDTPHGLIVPVVNDVPSLSIAAIAGELARLGAAAREQRLEPVALRGAGFTLSNLGGLGVSALQPLVSWPQVAILGVAAIEEQPGPPTGARAARLILPLTLGFDHRVINGADAARFLAAIDALVADPLRLAVAI